MKQEDDLAVAAGCLTAVIIMTVMSAFGFFAYLLYTLVEWLITK